MNDKQSAVESGIDALSVRIGNAVAWLTLVMVLVTSVIVVMRYAFEFGFIWLQEGVTWIHAVVFMLGAAYALQRDEHVRVDVFYQKMSPKQRGWVDAAGVILFLFPLCGFFLYECYDYVAVSWSIREVSVNAGGLRYPFVPLLKSVLLLMPIAVAVQGLSLLLASIRRIRGT
jgi:TRAP-type mannitol/chloroaromatic compound transport system permease small subunit